MDVRATALLCALALAACGADEVRSPWDSLPLDGRITVELEARVDVARDRHGIVHVRGQHTADLAFVHGFFMAHDRLAQMDALRRMATGTLAELYGRDASGNLRGDIIDSDLAMRTHRLSYFARATWVQLSADDRPESQEVVALLQRFSDGVNFYIGELKAGRWSLDPAILEVLPPDAIAPWSPIDSLAILRLHALSAAYSAPSEILRTELYERVRATFEPDVPAADPEIAARSGIARDLLALAPITTASTLDGFPNAPVQTGTESGDTTPTARRRPPPAALAEAHALLSAPRRVTIDGLGLFEPRMAGNAWAVGPSRTSGHALLANDPHGSLTSPSAFYATHLTRYQRVEDADTGDVVDLVDFDLFGATLPGIPGALVGNNRTLAWAVTPSGHDVDDVYLETFVNCLPLACVRHETNAIEIESRMETIRIGHLGREVEQRTATYETVPHHGPILPRIGPDHTVLPRDNTAILSVRSTAYAPSFEVSALWRLANAPDIAAAFDAVSGIEHGNQSYLFVDASQQIAWTTHAVVPQREDGAYTWNAATNPAGAAPFFVLDGVFGNEWSDRADAMHVHPRNLPHVVAPASDLVIATGADPVGATFDGDPLNQVTTNDMPLYVGVQYDNGLRQERIARLLADDALLTVDDMAAIQHDSTSTLGATLAPALSAALTFADAPSMAPAEVRDYVNQLAADQRTQLSLARRLVAGWTFGTPTADTIGQSSAATVLFHTWMHFFLERALGDELSAAGFDLWRLDPDHHARLVHALLLRGDSLVKNVATMQPVLCDRLGVAGDDSCTKLVLMAMLDAVGYLESPAGFGTREPLLWRWGTKHSLSFAPLVPGYAMPPSMAGLPRDGDTSSIARAVHGWRDLDLSQRGGSTLRMLVEADPAGMQVKWQLPGGTIFDQRSHHFFDLWQGYADEVHFDVPLESSAIAASGETRWEFAPP